MPSTGRTPGPQSSLTIFISFDIARSTTTASAARNPVSRDQKTRQLARMSCEN